jgi:hypothetical protein
VANSNPLHPDNVERKIMNLANDTVNSPAAQAVARMVAYKLHLPTEGEVYNELRRQLAYNWAQGYINGLEIGRARLVRLPPPPRLGPLS